MDEYTELVTVFRSADPSAEDDAQEIADLLEDAGLSPVVLGDGEPGIPEGAVEVRVPEGESDAADRLIEAHAGERPAPGDPSHDLDLETIFSALGTTAELEALGVRSVLEANEIPTIFVSPPQYPNLRFVVKVPKNLAGQARRILEEAEEAGPAAADEAERSSEP